MNKYKNIDIKEKFIPETELKKLIRECKFVVFPSQSYETFGISILEAYSYGKPVLASRIGALPEIIKDGETGILFEAGNSEEFCKKLKIMWRNPNIFHNMGNLGKEFVFNKYNPYNHNEKLMEIYSETFSFKAKLKGKE